MVTFCKENYELVRVGVPAHGAVCRQRGLMKKNWDLAACWFCGIT